MRRTILKLVSSNSIAQLIQFMSILYFTSFYSPSDFGVLAKVQSVSSIIVILITLQYQHVLPLLNEMEKVINLMLSVSIVSISLSLLLFFINFFINIDFFNYSIFLSIILGLTNVFISFNVFKGDFRKISIFQISRAILIFILNFILLKSGFTNGLIYSLIIGELFANLYLLITILSDVNVKTLKFSLLFIDVFKFKRFAFFGTIQEVASTLVYSIPLLYYIEQFGDNVGGQYSISFKIVFAPIVLISSSLNQVLSNKFGREKDFGLIRTYFWFDKRLILMALVLIVASFNLTTINNLFFNFDKWSLAIEFIPYLLVYGLIFLYSSPFRIALRSIMKNDTIFYIEVSSLIVLCFFYWAFNFKIITYLLISISLMCFQAVLMVKCFYKYENINPSI